MIYFAQDSMTLHIKIGYCARATFEQRLAALQTGNPSLLVLLACAAGGRADESSLHRQFAHARVRGEWFRPVPELLHFLFNLIRSQGCYSVPLPWRTGEDGTAEADEDGAFDDPDALTDGDRGPGRPPDVARQVRLVLADLLCNGPVLMRTIQEYADLHQIGWRTVMKVKADMGIRSIRREECWWWALPTLDADPDECILHPWTDHRRTSCRLP